MGFSYTVAATGPVPFNPDRRVASVSLRASAKMNLSRGTGWSQGQQAAVLWVWLIVTGTR